VGQNRSEVAEGVLATLAGISSASTRPASPNPLQFTGIGQQTAVRLKGPPWRWGSSFTSHPKKRPAINSPADAAALVQYEMSLLDQEYLKTSCWTPVTV